MEPGPRLDCLELVGGGEFKSFEKEAVIITKHDHVCMEHSCTGIPNSLSQRKIFNKRWLKYMCSVA